MKALVPTLLLFSLLALPPAAQAQSYRGGATVQLRDGCPSAADVASQTTDPAISSVLSNVAASINNGTGTGTCLRKIYVMAYTSGIRYAETNHAHLIEVVGAGQTRKIALPDRPNDYSLHKGDIWKLDIVNDFGFLPGTCLRPCNILNMTLAEGGINGWNIDSIVTYGCTSDFGCSPLTQDIDVNRWVDGDGREEHLRFPLSKVSQDLCI